MAQSGVWLAIGSGKVVQLIKQGTIGALDFKQVLGLSLNQVMNSYLGENHPPTGPT